MGNCSCWTCYCTGKADGFYSRHCLREIVEEAAVTVQTDAGGWTLIVASFSTSHVIDVCASDRGVNLWREGNRVVGKLFEFRARVLKL